MGSAPATNSASFDLANRREDIDRVEKLVLGALSSAGFGEASCFAVRLALEEAVANAFKHGHKGLAANLTIKLSYRLSEEQVQIDVVDQGPGFNPADVPDPTLEENLEKPSGRGLLLMRAYMTSIEHLGRGNHLRMVFRRV
jgi:serine/threonine-protein kinase RsbW